MTDSMRWIVCVAALAFLVWVAYQKLRAANRKINDLIANFEPSAEGSAGDGVGEPPTAESARCARRVVSAAAPDERPQVRGRAVAAEAATQVRAVP